MKDLESFASAFLTHEMLTRGKKELRHSRQQQAATS